MAKRPESDIAAKANEVLRSLGKWAIPVDPFAICEEEGIELCPGSYGAGFDGRIRYLAQIETFSLAYQDQGPGRTAGRIRFTIAHELGHYYLHRDYLLSGSSHGSEANFRSGDQMEQEADEFAAALLMPMELFRAAVRSYRQHVCVLNELCELADKRLRTSLTSAVRRYCQADVEPCAAIFSRAGKVQWACYSEDMRALGMGFVPYGRELPRQSRTARSIEVISSGGRIGGEIEPMIWFDQPRHQGNLWEEAMPLGESGIVLTYLTIS